MVRFRNDRVLTAVGVLSLFLATVAVFHGLGTKSSRIPFLPRQGGAEWIIYPLTRDLQTRPAVRLDALFYKKFLLDQVPSHAMARLRGFRSFQLKVNGQVASTPPSSNWKVPTEIDVTRLLRPGENQLEVRVENSKGPPALWLVLEAASLRVSTDETWEVSLAGAAQRPARLASKPTLEENYDYRFPSPIQEVQERPWLTLLLAIPGIVAWLVWNRWLPDFVKRSGAYLEWAAFAVVATAWIAMYLHNAAFLFPKIGFDVHGHLAYIDHLKDQRSLPRADEGWEMFQPPLYHATAATVVKLLGTSSAAEDAGKFPLQGLGLAAGLLQVGFVFLSLRLLFPESPGVVLVGLVLAAFLPMHLYMYQYTTNEGFAATWASASVYAALRIVVGQRDTVGAHVALGFALAAALNSKLTAVAILGVIVVVILGQVLVRAARGEPWKSGLAKLGLALLLAAGFGGFHYFRLWRDFGSPLVANWDPELGLAWWQDPGYHTWEYFIRFGHVFSQPFLLGAHSLPDAIYSTLWGDGLLGGTVQAWFWPPWNMERLAAGYLFAVVPSFAILVGLAGVFVVQIRHPRAEWFLLLGVAYALLAAIILMNLRLPYLSLAKAFFGMSAAIPLCALGCWGFRWLAEWGKWVGVLLAGAMSIWALNGYWTLWIAQGAVRTERFLGWSLTLQGRGVEGYEHFRRLLAMEPADHDAQFASVYALTGTERTEERGEHLREAMRLAPEDPGILMMRAMDELQSGNPAAGIRYCDRAIEVAPDYANAYTMKVQLLEAANEGEPLLLALREALRTAPTSAELQGKLASRLLEEGQIDEGLAHWILAAEIHANQLPRALKERREQIQRQLDETRAMAATGRRAEALAIVGLQLVGLNQVPQGTKVLEAAVQEARRTGQAPLASAIEERLRVIRPADAREKGAAP